jgi:hypothetical protein
MINFHSNWALAVLLLMSIAIANSAVKLILKKEFNTIDRKISLYAMIAVHIQFLLGIYVYFTSAIVQAGFSNMKAAMKDAMLRLFVVEHPMMMILGLGLITYGFVKTKKMELSNKKFRHIVIFYSLGLIFILSRIPWASWGH